MPWERFIDRRGFISTCVAGAIGLSAGPTAAGRLAESPSRPSRVSLAQDPGLRPSAKSGALDPRRTLDLLDRVILGLFDDPSPARAWARIVRPGERVGLKVNTLGGRGLSTSVAVVDAVCQRLQGAGIRASDIVVWDRDTAELERAGFAIRIGGDGVRCFGTDRVGYEDSLSAFGAVGSRVSKIVTSACDALIDMPVLKDHDGAGVSIALKNMFGAIHNPNKYHPNGCDPYVADVNMLPEIRGKLRLAICDATTAGYHGGPAFKPEYAWRANTLIASQDPVALDAIGWRMIERKRAEMGLPTLAAEDRPPRYIATAADAEHRLGTADTAKIALVGIRTA